MVRPPAPPARGKTTALRIRRVLALLPLVALAVAFLSGRPQARTLVAAGVALGVGESLATVFAGGGWREVVASGAVLLWLFIRGRTLLADA